MSVKTWLFGIAIVLGISGAIDQAHANSEMHSTTHSSDHAHH
jgi:hypothetical protein